MTDTVFNYVKTDYQKPLLLLGQRQGLFDTVNRHYPAIWRLSTKHKNRWIGTKTNSTIPRAMPIPIVLARHLRHDDRDATAAWRWGSRQCGLACDCAGAGTVRLHPELWAWRRCPTTKLVHAATYSEIVRNSFDDPSVILDEILRVQAAHDRLHCVAQAFAEGYEASHKYAIGQLPNDQTTYNAVFRPSRCSVLHGADSIFGFICSDLAPFVMGCFSQFSRHQKLRKTVGNPRRAKAI